MKKIYNLLLMPLAAMLWACSDDVIDDLSGTYDDIYRYNYTTESTGETDKLEERSQISPHEFL